eukprot:scaffold4027_cov158-Isochrysis_galbana.AAC.1
MSVGRVWSARAAAVLSRTVSLVVKGLRDLLGGARLSIAIACGRSVNGAACRSVRVACETHTGV